MAGCISIHAPCEGGEWLPWQNVKTKLISIHAPCEGGEAGANADSRAIINFNPRPLRGGRPGLVFYLYFGRWISIHAPCEGGDPHHLLHIDTPPDFNPRPLRGGRPGLRDFFKYVRISIHAPCEGGDALL